MPSEPRAADALQRAVTFVAHEVTDAGGMERATRHLVEGLLRRGWHVTERSVRPDHRMVGHTGFLTVARRIV